MSIDARLRQAREARRYPSARKAAEAMGANYSSYTQHENGTRSLSAGAAQRYARFYRVSLDWLMTGRGEMAPRERRAAALPFMGTVGAGSSVESLGDAAWAQAADWIDLPNPDETFALTVKGDSGEPRYHHGDTIMVSRRPRLPEEMIGRYCVLDLADGRRVLKRLGRVRGVFVLESQNAPTEEAPVIVGCYRVCGVLTD